MKRNPLLAVRPSIGLEVEYRRRLEALVDAMARSVEYWLKACYRANEPEMAQDTGGVAQSDGLGDGRTAPSGYVRWESAGLVSREVVGSNPTPSTIIAGDNEAPRASLLAPSVTMDASPAAILDKTMRALGRRWRKNFAEASQELADYYATAAEERSTAALKNILKRGGISVKFSMTRGTNDVLRAAIAEQVSLIKSIPEQYLTQVQGSVMRSVQAGRDLKGLVRDLRKHHGVSRRRAEFIARDQNNKATAAINRARQLSLGLEQGEWIHSSAGRHPRPTHVKQDGKRFSLKDGWYDPAIKRRIWPGTEPNCRCVWKPVIPALQGKAA